MVTKLVGGLKISGLALMGRVVIEQRTWDWLVTVKLMPHILPANPKVAQNYLELHRRMKPQIARGSSTAIKDWLKTVEEDGFQVAYLLNSAAQCNVEKSGTPLIGSLRLLAESLAQNNLLLQLFIEKIHEGKKISLGGTAGE